MKNNLIYRGPEPSHATRIPARRSKGSLRGSMVAMLPGFQRPRLIYFESALEYVNRQPIVTPYRHPKMTPLERPGSWPDAV